MITPEDKVALYDATIEQLDKELAEMLDPDNFFRVNRFIQELLKSTAKQELSHYDLVLTYKTKLN